MLWDQGRWIPEPGKDPSKTIEEGHLHFTLEGERMKGEWVMFRLKPQARREGRAVDAEEGRRRIRQARRRRGAGRRMRDQRHHRPDDGRDRRRRSDVWRSNRGGQEGRPREDARPASAPPPFRRRSWRPWSTRCRPATTGCTNINMTATGCWSRPATARRPPGPATATTGATSSGRSVKAAAQAARRLPDRRRGGGARQEGQARASSCCSRRSRAARRDLAFYAFDLLVDQGEDITQAAQHRAQGAAGGAAQGRQPADPLWRPCHRQGRGAVRRDLQGGRRGDHLEEGRGALQRRRGRATGSRSNASSGRNSSSSAGRKATSATASARCSSACDDGRQADLCRQGRHRLRHQADRRADATGWGRWRSTRRRSKCRAPSAGARTGSSPKLVAEIAFTEFTADGILRHPSFIALREDKPAKEVVREKPQASDQGRSEEAERETRCGDRRGFRHQDQQPRPRDLPGRGLTKGELADYYAAVEPLMHGRRRQPADQPGPLPAGPRQANASSRSTTAARSARTSSMCRSRRRTARSQDYLYVEDIRGPARLRADGDDRIPRLGQQGRQGRKSRPAGVRPRSRRRPRLRRR